MVSADFFNVEMRFVLLIVYYMFYLLFVNQEWGHYREMSGWGPDVLTEW